MYLTGLTLELTHYNTLQHAATCCNTLQLAATYCNMHLTGLTLVQNTATATHCTHCKALQHSATRYNTVLHD